MKKEHSHGGFRSFLKRNFLTGVLVLVPITGTILLFSWGFEKITNVGLEQLKKWDYFNDLYNLYEQSYNIIGRLIVIFVLFGLISLVGLLTRNLIGRKALRIADRIFENIPLFNRIFTALKQVSHAFIGADKSIFSYAVLFEYPRTGVYSVGFVMSESKGEVQEKTKEDMLSIFLPTTPNPTSGLFMMVPRNDTIRLSMSVEDALKMIISGGAVVPEYKKNEIVQQHDGSDSEIPQPQKEKQVPTGTSEKKL